MYQTGFVIVVSDRDVRGTNIPLYSIHHHEHKYDPYKNESIARAALQETREKNKKSWLRFDIAQVLVMTVEEKE